MEEKKTQVDSVATTVAVTEGVAGKGTEKERKACVASDAPMTKEQARNLSDEEILDMVKRAKGNTSTEEFKKLFNVDFSYSFLTNILQERGYVKDWHREAEVNTSGLIAKKSETTTIKLQKEDGETVRKSLSMNKEVSERWSDFCKRFPYNTIVTNAALTMFMNSCECGKVRFEFDFK